ncbi:protein kinase [Prosthecobacter sp. SYSU 5D2]|uniref:protein kinase domain-containing protein n=1 Tax=Prosthecobacter sp. SYSU 5D2 TaxID=3134134 RepID=UPI0031FE8A56
MGKKPDANRPSSHMNGLNPLGLMDGVMGGQGTDWEPPMAEELEPLFPGYHDFEFIDRGGMGAVYAATQRSLERRVAIKILPPEMGQDAAFVDRFHQEARLLARLQHPHIVAIYDFGRNDSGHLYIVMEYVEGTSLLDIMKLARLPLAKTLEVTTQICEALQFAHDHGVIHRDIKPTNILIDVWGRVRVADFGLAKLSAASPSAPTTSRTGLAMGTPGYAAPEQRRGEASLDHRADIFSLGVTLYEMLTGHLPVGVFEPPSKKSDAPAILDKVVTRALRERPGDRFQRAAEMRSAIHSTLERLQRPMVQRAIAKRPIVSMMTSVIVGAGFIYLLDEINTQVLQKPAAPLPVNVENEHGPTVIRLNQHFSLLRLKLNWEESRRRVKATQGVEMASFHSAQELSEVVARLRELEVRAPVWTGGSMDPVTGAFRWDDGSPADFEAWMPAAPSPPLLITEIQAKNQRTLFTSTGVTPDWIEVHNPGTSPVDLSGWHLRHITGRYAFEGRLGSRSTQPPAAPLLIQPGEYRVIFCLDDDPAVQEKLAFGFQLEAQTGRLRWSDPRGNGIQGIRQDWTRFPADASLIYDAATQTWSWSARPTPGAPNAAPAELFIEAPEPAQTPQAVLMLPDFDGRWSMDTQRRTAWTLLRHTPKARK